MTSRIVLPKVISEEIRYDGREATKKRLEAVGSLFGLYNHESDSVLVSERYFLTQKFGDGSPLGDSLDELVIRLSIPRFREFGRKVDYYRQKTKENGEISALVIYHSHPISCSWSSKDLNALKEFSELEDIVCAMLLYIPSDDTFLAVDNDGNPITVSINDIEQSSLQL